MIFADLCAKDNGTAYKSFGLYTFIKVWLFNKLLLFIVQQIYIDLFDDSSVLCNVVFPGAIAK